MKRVTLPWYGVLLFSIHTALAIIGIGAVCTYIVPLFGRENLIVFIVSVIVLWRFYCVVRDLWTGVSSSPWRIFALNVFFSICAISSAPSRDVGEAALCWVTYALLVGVLVFVTSKIPGIKSWYIFRAQWRQYKKENPKARLQDLEIAQSVSSFPVRLPVGTVMNWAMNPVLAWPFLILGLCGLGFAYMFYSRCFDNSYKMPGTEGWFFLSVVLMIAGAALIVVSLVSLSKKNKDKANQ